MQPKSKLHKAGLWYAHHGIRVFPLIPGSKKPVVKDWENQATTSTDQVDRWWSRNPNYNIGIACGPSNLVVIDFDTHKSGVHTDILFDDDDLVNTIISRTPHGGTHVWFKQPADMTLSNARGDLPYGIDVRGHGGYIVAPPSQLITGGGYTFLEEHRPSDVSGETLPISIAKRLLPEQRVPRSARETTDASEKEIAEALSFIPRQMSYEEWLFVLMAVHSVYDDDRGIALCEEWSPGHKGEVAKKFASFKKSSGRSIATLFHMAATHGYRIPAPQPSEDVRTQLFNARGWVNSSEGVIHIRKAGARQAPALISLLNTLLSLAHERGTWRVSVTHRTLAALCDVSAMASWRRVQKLGSIGMLNIEQTEQGNIIDLSPLASIVSVTALTNGDTVTLTIEENDWQAEHRNDDAFASYPYWNSVARRGDTAPQMTSLGATGLLLWPYLKRGFTLRELSYESGLSVSSVRHAIGKFMSLGLVEAGPICIDDFYILIKRAEDRLDEVRPHMTTFCVGMMRRGRNHSATADYAAFRLRKRKEMTEKDIMFWTNLRDDNDQQAQMYFDICKENGFNATMRVGKEKRVEVRARRFKGTRPVMELPPRLMAPTPAERLGYKQLQLELEAMPHG